MKPLVSVIIPIYNVEKYLKICIDSILRQTYKNLEIILCDDGSTDKSGEICEEYSKKDERIVVIHKENKGAADTRNCGVKAAHGQFIAFIDSDDIVHEKYIEIFVKIVLQNDADIVVGDFIVFNSESDCADKNLTDSDICAAETMGEKQLYDDEFIRREAVRFIVPWGKLCRSTLYEGIYYPVGKINEDTYTTYKLMEKANKIIYIKEPLYYWRENQESVTRKKFSVDHLSGLDAYMEQIEYYHSLKKQRHVEIAFDQFRGWFFWAYNQMVKENMNYQKELFPYYKYMKKKIHYLRLTKSLGWYKWLNYRYIVWYKIPYLLKNK